MFVPVWVRVVWVGQMQYWRYARLDSASLDLNSEEIRKTGHDFDSAKVVEALIEFVISDSGFDIVARRHYSPGPDDGASEAVADEKPKQSSKSRTGGDTTDDGQVFTASLNNTRSILDFFDTKKETEDRHAAEKEKA